MSMRTLLEDIHTSRIFVQSEKELRYVSRVLGTQPQGMMAKTMGYCQSYCNDLDGGNWLDDMKDMRQFYDLLREGYGVSFSYPKQNPYLKYVEYIKSLGNGFRVDDQVIGHLRKHCNTLIISDQAEFEYLHDVYKRLKRLSTYLDKKVAVPARFAALQNTKTR